MDKDVFINKKTFEIEDEDENVFICDRHIAPAVAELNKKGYKTLFSCEGHIVFGWTEIDHCDLSLLEETEKDKRFIVLRVYDDGFDYLTEHTIADIYILFAQNYHFHDLPLGFKIDEEPNSFVIRKTIEYYDGERKKTMKELESEKEDALSSLYEWTKKLPKKLFSK